MPKKKSDFEYRRWGKEFKDGKLYDFTKKHVLVMSPWPNPRAWFKTRSHGWQCTRIEADKAISSLIRVQNAKDWESPEALLDDGDLGYDGPESMSEAELAALAEETEEEKSWQEWWKKRRKRDRQNIVKYLAPIPRKTRKMISRYADRNWQILNLFARCPGVEDLHRSNPALVMALANSWSFQKEPVKRPMRAARALVKKKQKEILRWLGFPATESFRKILAKIPADSLHLKDLLYLRHWSRDERVVKLLSHLDRINEAVIHLVTSEERIRVLTPQLLAEVSQLTNKMQMMSVQSYLQDVFRMKRRVSWRDCPKRFISIARLKAVHDHLVESVNRFAPQDQALADCDFPDPPFRGTPTIWPIMTPKELSTEGAAQRNCVASYAEMVLKGSEYVYRVYHPVRATLSIVKTTDGWREGQLEMSCNRQVVPELKKELFTALFNSGDFVPAHTKEPEEDREDPQLPLGMTQEAWRLVQLVEESFGRSQSIEIQLPRERISA